jgi:hypothetical protein
MERLLTKLYKYEQEYCNEDVFSLLVMCFCNQQLWSQTDSIETLFRRKQKGSVHFFFEPEVKMYFQKKSFEESAALVLGSKSALILNKSIIVGLAAYGKVTPSTYYNEYRYINKSTGNEIIIPNQKMRTGYGYGYGYGGLVLGGIIRPYKSVHLSITSLVGDGTANEYIIKENGSKGTTFNSPGFFVIEPNLDVEANFSKYLRLKMGLTYKHIFGNNFQSLSSAQLSGIGIQAGFKIGAF